MTPSTHGAARTIARGSRRAIAIARGALAALAAALLGGCQSPPELVPPEVIVSPYPLALGEPVLAIAPLRNESGTSFADTLAVSDALVARAAEVRGVSALPVNRTIAAMRALGIAEIRTVGQARAVAATVGADGIIVGSITAYDPYDPPTLGLTLGLYAARPGALTPGPVRGGIDVARLERSAAEGIDPAAAPGALDLPLSVVSELLDAHSHEVQMNVRRYAEGRTPGFSALGWKQYLASAPLYTDFAAWWSVSRLMQEERLRLARLGGAALLGAQNAWRDGSAGGPGAQPGPARASPPAPLATPGRAAAE